MPASDFPTSLATIADGDLITIKRDFGDGNFVPLEVTALQLKTYCGGGGGGSGLTFTPGSGDPPSIGSVSTLGYRDTSLSPSAKYINVNWPTTNPPIWEAI
jgi:hypothetical protein